MFLPRNARAGFDFLRRQHLLQILLYRAKYGYFTAPALPAHLLSAGSRALGRTLMSKLSSARVPAGTKFGSSATPLIEFSTQLPLAFSETTCPRLLCAGKATYNKLTTVPCLAMFDCSAQDRSLEATGTCGDCGLNKKDFNDLEDQGKRVICDPLCSQDGADHRGCGWEGRFIECRECSMWGDWNWDNSYPCGASNTCAQPYQQCGGAGWTGPACCPPNHFCTEDQYDPGYLQCLPNDKKTQAPVTATPTTPAPSATPLTQEPTAAVTAPPTPEPTQAAPETVAPTAAPTTIAPTAPPLATPKPTHKKKKTKKPTAQPTPTPTATPTPPPTAAATTLRPTAAPGACDKVNSACTLLAATAAAAAGNAPLPLMLPSTCCGGLECVVEVTGGAAGRCADPATAAAVSLLVTARAHPGNDCALAAAQAVVGAQTSGLCGDDCAVLSATVAACQRAAEARRGRRLLSAAAADAPQQWRQQRGSGAARELAAVCAADAAASCDVSIELSMVHLGGFEGAQAGVAALLAPPGLRAIAQSMGVPPAQVTVSNIAVQGAAQQGAGAPPVGGGIDGGGSGSAQPPPADTAAQPGAGSYWVISVIAVVLAAVWIVGLCVLWRVLRARRAARRALADKVAHFKELEAAGGYVKEGGGGGGGDGEAYHFKLTSSVKTMLGKAFEESQADDEFSYAVSTRSGRSKQSTSRSSRAPSAAPSGALSHARTRASLYASSYVSSSRGSPRSTTEDEDESSRSSGGGGGGGDVLSVDMSLSTYDTRDTRFHRMRALTPTSRAASISEVSGGGYGGDGGSSSSSSSGSPQRSAAAPLRSHPPTPAATAPQPRGDAAPLKLFLFNSVATADSAISALTEKTGTFGSISGGGGGGGDGASVYFTDADAGAGSAAGDGSVSLCARSVLSDGDGPLPINAVSPISRHM
ncbi:hypothetical protein JKP88DRAFT_264749 [Tribonema minus]|uniref:CBM1 domain-containing protein n=1 Tax=Tribonema minus TaxID=303371 RepID=A0A835YNL4_9STRA|nr:hypothetical protein JKP88DRAFT_264749 [Tribonema minus]